MQGFSQSMEEAIPGVKYETENCSLPEDAIIEILLRLPVKSLLRFRTVSKSWYSYLISRDFIHKHRQQPVHEKLIRVSDRGPRDKPTVSFFSYDHSISFNPDEENDHSVVDVVEAEACCLTIDLPFNCSGDDEVRVVGSCNGLFCVHFSRSSCIVLWNVATRKYRFLELPDCVSFYLDPFFPYIIFGYVPENDDYKVVKVLSSRRKESGDSKVWVYTLSSDYWEEMRGEGLRGLIPKGGSAVSVNGWLYWISCSDGDGVDVITCFDLCKQVFGRVKLPDSDIVGSLVVVKLVVLKGCLSVIMDCGDGVNVNHYEVWVMNEQQGAGACWIKRFDFSPFSKIARPVGSWKDGELLFGYPNGLSLELVSYNPSTKRIRSFQRRSLAGRFKAINYVESLESVERR